MRRRVAVLVSGRGSNLAALLAASCAADYPARIALVLSNRPDADGLAIAAEGGVPAEAVDHRPFGGDRAGHEAVLDAKLREAGIEIVCLAGYMRRLTPLLVGAWRGRMLNIHPSLLPSFPGLDTHARALAAGVCLHGCTVHLVTEDVDAGPILAQAAVPVLPGRVLAQEHILYPAALRAVAGGPAVRTPETASLINLLPVNLLPVNLLPDRGALK